MPRKMTTGGIICTVPGCEANAGKYTSGYCNRHYLQFSMFGHILECNHPGCTAPAAPRKKFCHAHQNSTGKTTKRTCLNCGKNFDSKGIHNRLCEICAERNGKVAQSNCVIRLDPNRISANE